MKIGKNWFMEDGAPLDDIRENFMTPPREYRPNMFWFWIDKAPDPENYREQAAGMAKQGISCGYAQDRGFNWKTPDLYFECFDAALDETKKAGLTMGYCERACYLKGDEFRGGDPDMTAVTLGCKAITVRRGEKAAFEKGFFTVSARISDDGLIDSDSVSLIPNDVSEFFAEDGDYRVFPFYKYTAATMEGCKSNLLCRKAADRAMKTIHEPYLKRYAGEAGKTLSGHFFDWEGAYGYKLAYSTELETAFRERTGDELRLICPLLLEKDVQGKWMRARYNWFDTVSELYADINFGIASDKLAEYGMYYLVHLWEEHLLGKALLAGDPMRVYRAVTMPAIDHLFKDFNRVCSYKEAQSVCEFDGKRFADELLGCCGWELKPDELRSSVNNALSLGVSNFIPHGAYSRRDDIKKAGYAPDFFDWSPMWEHFGQCADYMTRGAFIISKGHMDADTLLYNPLESVWALLGDHAFDDTISNDGGWLYDKPD